MLGEGRHARRELANSLRRQRGAIAVEGRAVIRDAGDHDVGAVDRVAGEAAPGQESGEVHLCHVLRISGTFRMSTPPTSSQTKNTVKMTGYPPGRPSTLGPLLNSRRNPPTKRAMTPEPAVAILLKPMNRPASPGGMMSWMKAQSTKKNSPDPIPIKNPTRVARTTSTRTLRAWASGTSKDRGHSW